MTKRRGSDRWPLPVSLLLFELAFLVAYSLHVRSIQGGAALVWFPDAVLLCGLLLSHPKEWWLYILATVPIRFFLFIPGTPLWFLLACFASDSLKGLLSAWLLRRLSQDGAWFDNLHEFSWYFLVAVVIGPGLSAFASAASYTLLGNHFGASYKIQFFGDALASLMLAPFILLVLDGKRFVPGKPRYGEAALVAAGLVATTYITFQSGPEGVGFSPFFLYLPLPF